MTGAAPVRVAIDVDAGLRVRSVHVGPKRSPLRGPEQVAGLGRALLARRGLSLVSVTTYAGQVAGVPDGVPAHRTRSLAVRRRKAASGRQLADRRAAIAAALTDLGELQAWNAGGSGGLEVSAADPAVTEVSARPGLLVPFDHYRSLAPRPAAYSGVPVVRRPSDDCVSVAGGRLIASGPAGGDRSPVPWAPPGLQLTSLEGAGEVQTPLVRPGAATMRTGDLVWFRHAEPGEVAEHVREAHLVSGDRVTETVPTFRGTGNAW